MKHLLYFWVPFEKIVTVSQKGASILTCSVHWSNFLKPPALFVDTGFPANCVILRMEPKFSLSKLDKF